MLCVGCAEVADNTCYECSSTKAVKTLPDGKRICRMCDWDRFETANRAMPLEDQRD